jgi:Prefoldin subunit
MSEQELPPWLKEQLSRLQQLQQNLQAIMMQKQQVEIEIVETDRALEELKKVVSPLVDVILSFYTGLLLANSLEVFSNILAVLAAILENSFTSSFSR